MLKNFLKFRKLVKTNIIPSQYFALKYDSYNNLVHSSSNLPDKDHYNLEYLERSEIESRIMKVLSHFENVNLKTFNWKDDLEKGLKLDSLDQTALLTSIEEEFNLVFEDRVFDSFKTLEDVIRFIASDNMAF